jgi:hypothetical protein
MALSTCVLCVCQYLGGKIWIWLWFWMICNILRCLEWLLNFDDGIGIVREGDLGRISTLTLDWCAIGFLTIFTIGGIGKSWYELLFMLEQPWPTRGPRSSLTRSFYILWNIAFWRTFGYILRRSPYFGPQIDDLPKTLPPGRFGLAMAVLEHEPIFQHPEI